MTFKNLASSPETLDQFQSNKLNTLKNLWVMETQVCANRESNLFPNRDNNEIHRGNLKIFSFRTTIANLSVVANGQYILCEL